MCLTQTKFDDALICGVIGHDTGHIVDASSSICQSHSPQRETKYAQRLVQAEAGRILKVKGINGRLFSYVVCDGLGSLTLLLGGTLAP